MRIQAEVSASNPAACTFRVDSPELSQYGWQGRRNFYFRAPLPSAAEEYRHNFELIGSKGEALVRELCKIPGVESVCLAPNRVLVVIRSNSQLAWANLIPQVWPAFSAAFPDEVLQTFSDGAEFIPTDAGPA